MECKTCFFTDKFPGVVIEKNGRCNYCNRVDHEKMSRDNVGGMEKLKHIADRLKAKKGKYDCLIPASGGLDSSYVVYFAVKILGLNPLVISYNSGFCTDIARKNIETICKNLGVDLEVVESKHAYDKKYVKFMTCALKDIDLYWGVCTSCIYMISTVIFQYEPAKKNIPAYFMASNPYEESTYISGKFKTKTMLKRLLKLPPMRFLRTLFYILVAQYYLFRLKIEFYVPPVSNIFRAYPKRPAGMEWINPEEYINWDIDAMLFELEKIGWEKPAAPQLPLRFDCKIEKSLVDHTFKKATGITIHSVMCNNFIYRGLREKTDLQNSAKWYDDNLPVEMKKLMSTLYGP